jgi:prepilin-type processing-associated H-X9-DG protein
VEVPDRYAHENLLVASIFVDAHRTVERPEHLLERVTWRRHGASSNVLFADGSVGRSDGADIALHRFDDGIRNRRW